MTILRTNSFRKTEVTARITINELRMRKNSGKQLTSEQELAITNFDNYKEKFLNNPQMSNQQFYRKYMQIQVMANLSSYDEFLKEGY